MLYSGDFFFSKLRYCFVSHVRICTYAYVILPKNFQFQQNLKSFKKKICLRRKVMSGAFFKILLLEQFLEPLQTKLTAPNKLFFEKFKFCSERWFSSVSFSIIGAQTFFGNATDQTCRLEMKIRFVPGAASVSCGVFQIYRPNVKIRNFVGISRFFKN